MFFFLHFFTRIHAVSTRVLAIGSMMSKMSILQEVLEFPELGMEAVWKIEAAMSRVLPPNDAVIQHWRIRRIKENRCDYAID